MSVVIQASNLTRKFGDLVAVDNLSLEVSAGEIFALVGPDGAGKTTTMRLLCGLMNATEGSATVSDAVVVSGNAAPESPFVRTHAGHH